MTSSWLTSIRAMNIPRSIFTTLRGKGLPRIFLAPNGFIGSFIPWIWFLGVGTFRKSFEDNNRLVSSKHSIFLNILIYFIGSSSKGSTPPDQELYISPSTKGHHTKSGMLVPSTSGKVERGHPLSEGRGGCIEDDEPRGT